MFDELTTQRGAAKKLDVPRYVVAVLSDMYAVPTVKCPGNAKGRCYTRESMRRLERYTKTWRRKNEAAKTSGLKASA